MNDVYPVKLAENKLAVSKSGLFDTAFSLMGNYYLVWVKLAEYKLSASKGGF